MLEGSHKDEYAHDDECSRKDECSHEAGPTGMVRPQGRAYRDGEPRERALGDGEPTRTSTQAWCAHRDKRVHEDE